MTKKTDNPFVPEEIDLEIYQEGLLDFLRERTTDNEGITSLNDQDILYIIELWDEYAEQFEDVLDNDEVVEIEPEDFYNYVTETSIEDGQDIDISLEDLSLLIMQQQIYNAFLYDYHDPFHELDD